MATLHRECYDIIIIVIIIIIIIIIIMNFWLAKIDLHHLDRARNVTMRWNHVLIPSRNTPGVLPHKKP